MTLNPFYTAEDQGVFLQVPTGQANHAHGMKTGSANDPWNVATIPASNLASIGLMGLCEEADIKG